MRDFEVVEQPTDLNQLSSRYVQEASDFINSANSTPWFLYMAFNHVREPSSVAPFKLYRLHLARIGSCTRLRIQAVLQQNKARVRSNGRSPRTNSALDH